MFYTPVTLGSGLAGYNYLSRTRDNQQAIFDRDPFTAREVARATEKLQSVQNVDDLMSDRTLLKVALGAFGLEEDLNNRAFIKKILESDVSDRRSLVNRLTDKRYLSLARAFNFGGGDGPQLPNERGGDELTEKMKAVKTPDDLLSDPSLLRASLERFGLEANSRNTYFLKRVLESDLSDPKSFANRMPDERLVDFAKAFDFHQRSLDRAASRTPADELVDLFAGKLDALSNGQDLIDAPELLEAALDIFGLDNVYSDTFLEDVLDSDLNDPGSIANTQKDTRLRAFAAAFSFATPELDASDNPVLDGDGNTVFRKGTLETFLDAFSERPGPFATADEFMTDLPLRSATFALLDIPNTLAAQKLANHVLTSDLEDRKSFANLFPDPRYKALSGLISIEPVSEERTYPEGFVDQVVRNYLDRQFEIRVGEVDPSMRIALSLEREIGQVVANSKTNDAQWYSIMSSPPLRKAFEGALRLPESFGSIDIDQQLKVLKSRAQKSFGTSTVRDFLNADKLDELRRSYLVNSSTQVFGSTSSASAASILLANL